MVCLGALISCRSAETGGGGLDRNASAPQPTGLRQIGQLPRCGWGIGAMVFSPDGENLIVAAGTRGTFGAKGELLVWDLAAKKTVRRVNVKRSYCRLLVLPGGKRLVALDRYRVDVWTLERMESTSVLRGGPWFDMAVSPSGQFLALVGEGHKVSVVRVDGFEVVKVLRGAMALLTVVPPPNLAVVPAGFAVHDKGGGRIIVGPNGESLDYSNIWSPSYALFSKDGRHLYVNGETWSTQSWEKIADDKPTRDLSSGPDLSAAKRAWAIEGRSIVERLHSGTSVLVVFSPDGRTMATAGTHITDGWVFLWRPEYLSPHRPAAKKL